MVGSAYSPSFGARVRVTSEPLPNDPDLAVAYTVRRMSQYAREDASSDVVRDCLLDATKYGACDTWQSIAGALHSWLRRHVVFEDDDIKGAGAGYGSGHEVLVRPVDLLAMASPSGDCDCFCMAFGALMLRAIQMYGLSSCRVWFVTVATDGYYPEQFTHVYCCVSAGSQHVDALPVDASHGEYAGWEVANHYGKKSYWPLEGLSMFAQAIGYRPLAGLSRGRRPLGCTGYGGLVPLAGLGDNADSTTLDFFGCGGGGAPVDTSTPGVSVTETALDPLASSGVITFGPPAGGPGPLPGASSTSLASYFNQMWGGAPVSGPTYTSTNPNDSTNWTSVFNNLIAAGATVAKADMTGTVIRMPNGQTVSYAGVVPSSAQVAAASGVSSSSIFLYGGLALGLVLLLSAMKR